jgi:uncharacterized DUF497 family protein
MASARVIKSKANFARGTTTIALNFSATTGTLECGALAVGLAGAVLIPAVAHAALDHAGKEVIRIISARKATASERREYAD